MTNITKMNAKMVMVVAYLLVLLCCRPSMSFMDYSSMRRINNNNRVMTITKSKEEKWRSIRKCHSLFSTLRSHPSPITPPPPPPPPPPIQLHSPSFNGFENTELLKRTTSSTRQEEVVVASASVVKAPKKFIPYPFQVSFKIMEVFF